MPTGAVDGKRGAQMDLDRQIARELAGWPVGAASAAVIDATGVIASGDDAEVRPWASVTKIVSALTVLDLIGEGIVGLHDPAGPPGATIAHLLAHTSGLPFEIGGPGADPGTRRIYSNEGFDVLAAHVAAVVGTPFPEIAAERILEPLGMDRSEIAGSAAKDGRGPLSDLALLAGELLSPRLLDPESVAAASTLAFPGLDGLLPGFGRQSPNDWGLGMEIRGHKRPHWTGEHNSPATFGHFGQSGSFLWVDPVAGLGCVSLSDTPFGAWAAAAWPRLADLVLRHRDLDPATLPRV